MSVRPSGSICYGATVWWWRPVMAGLAGPTNQQLVQLVLLLLLARRLPCAILVLLVLHALPASCANARRPSGMRCSKGPCLLRTPHLGVARSVFVPLHAPVTSLSLSNMDIDLLGKHPALVWLSWSSRDASLLRFGRCKLAVRNASQPLVLGCDSRFGPITGLRGRPG